MKIYAYYTQCPSSSQQETGLSLINKYCHENNIVLDHICTDTDDNHGLTNLIADLTDGDTVITPSLAQLSHNPFIAHWAFYTINKKAKLILIIPDDPLFLQQFNLAKDAIHFFNTMNNKVTSIRSTIKHKEMKAQNKRTGKLPWGFKSVKGQVIPDEHEQAVANRIIDLFNQGTTMYRISKILTNENVKQRSTGDWHHTYVKSIIHNFPKNMIKYSNL